MTVAVRIILAVCVGTLLLAGTVPARLTGDPAVIQIADPDPPEGG